MYRRLSAVLACGAVLFVGGSAPAHGQPSPIATAAAQLDALQAQIDGTLRQHRASERLNVARRHCRGPFVSHYRDFTEQDFGYGTGRASLFDSVTYGPRGYVLNALAVARVARARVDPRCSGDVDPFPVDAEKLNAAEEVELFEPVEADPRVDDAMKSYQPCMKTRYGYVVDDRDDFLNVPERLDYRDAPVDGEQPSAAWQREVADITHVFAADADCRRPAYDIAMTLLAPRIGPWEQKHRREIAAVQAVWQQYVVDAARL
jgi:hypothetical protein